MSFSIPPSTIWGEGRALSMGQPTAYALLFYAGEVSLWLDE